MGSSMALAACVGVHVYSRLRPSSLPFARPFATVRCPLIAINIDDGSEKFGRHFGLCDSPIWCGCFAREDGIG
jgi:hypothetical protein